MRCVVAALVLWCGAVGAATAQPPPESVAAAPFPGTVVDAATLQARLRAYFFDAARRGDAAMIKEFVAASYDMETRDEKGYTALILAAYHGHAAAVRLLLEAGADPCAEDQRGNTALMGAIFRGEIAISRLLLTAACDPDHRNRSGQTPAMYAALFGRMEVLGSLAEKGADLQAVDGAGNSAQSLLEGRRAD